MHWKLTMSAEDTTVAENAAAEQVEVDEAEQAAEGTSDHWSSVALYRMDNGEVAVPNWIVC